MYKFEWDVVNEVIRVSIWGQQETDSLSAETEEFINLLKKLPGKINVLVDYQSGGMDIAFLKIINVEPKYLDLFKKKIKRIAVFGLGVLQRMKLEIMLGVGGSENIRLFNSEGDALEWLKEDE